MQWDGPADFAAWFVDTFCDPFLKVLSEHTLLGYSLDVWLLSASLIGLAAMFIKAFFHKGDEKG